MNYNERRQPLSASHAVHLTPRKGVFQLFYSRHISLELIFFFGHFVLCMNTYNVKRLVSECNLLTNCHTAGYIVLPQTGKKREITCGMFESVAENRCKVYKLSSSFRPQSLHLVTYTLWYHDFEHLQNDLSWNVNIGLPIIK